MVINSNSYGMNARFIGYIPIGKDAVIPQIICQARYFTNWKNDRILELCPERYYDYQKNSRLQPSFDRPSYPYSKMYKRFKSFYSKELSVAQYYTFEVSESAVLKNARDKDFPTEKDVQEFLEFASGGFIEYL
jgi:hypothetical protein